MGNISALLNDNEASLDAVAFKLRLAELMALELAALREQLGLLACDTPHLCLQLCGTMLIELRGFKSAPMCDKRKALFYAAKRALDAMERLERALDATSLATEGPSE
ncbi:hypothetical protein [Shewanella sp. KCT]|uniref:hypothetical protein n=1 Tax=Shewanella sp. KCT TaxID=2569535 RepID=UPI001183873F|nr:hypothetical protein [Shewanella sp. KCT]TVP10566.1 hypothetical protein AYI87_17545 [Shewanella sp. KCT]